MRNYYKVLGISESASPLEIKNAYYKLVKQWHPDHNPHTPISDIMMKMFNEAYSVLSDPQKKQAYDESIRIQPSSVVQHTYSYETEETLLRSKDVATHFSPMKTVVFLAAALFFSLFIIDSVSSIFLSRPLEGVYYPVSGKLPLYVERDWTNRSSSPAPFHLAFFAFIWFMCCLIQKPEGGLRTAAFISSVLIPMYWVVPLMGAELYGLKLNYLWLASMIFSNVIFLIFAFIGKGTINDLFFSKG
jgi:hypothetical protein